jgi:cardiolipin synthase
MPPLLRVGVPLDEADAERDDQPVRVLGEAYTRKRRQIVRAYLYRIYNARERVWLTNSYFVPDPAIRRALKRAAGRGVDVRVLLPGRSDVPIVRIASQAIYEQLLTSGVRIFEWHDSILHAKTAVIDGTWSTIGTFNLDYRSLRSNLEVNVAVLDRQFGAVMERSFQADLGLSQEVDLDVFRQRALPNRMLQSLAYRFRKLL